MCGREWWSKGFFVVAMSIWSRLRTWQDRPYSTSHISALGLASHARHLWQFKPAVELWTRLNDFWNNCLFRNQLTESVRKINRRFTEKEETGAGAESTLLYQALYTRAHTKEFFIRRYKVYQNKRPDKTTIKLSRTYDKLIDRPFLAVRLGQLITIGYIWTSLILTESYGRWPMNHAESTLPVDSYWTKWPEKWFSVRKYTVEWCGGFSGLHEYL